MSAKNMACFFKLHWSAQEVHVSKRQPTCSKCASLHALTAYMFQIHQRTCTWQPTCSKCANLQSYMPKTAYMFQVCQPTCPKQPTCSKCAIVPAYIPETAQMFLKYQPECLRQPTCSKCDNLHAQDSLHNIPKTPAYMPETACSKCASLHARDSLHVPKAQNKNKSPFIILTKLK